MHDTAGCLWELVSHALDVVWHWLWHTRWVGYLFSAAVAVAGLFLLFGMHNLWWGLGLTAAGVLCFIAIATSANDPGARI